MKDNIIISYFAGVWSELKKVSWPTRNEVINHTVVVVVSAAVATMVTAAMDFGLSRLIEILVQNKI